jgi:hypothetical protein
MGFFRELFGFGQTDADYLRTHCLLAAQVPAKKRRLSTMQPWGLCVHTTGRGVIKRAAERDTTPLLVALGIYSASAGPHYVADVRGTLYQIQPDDRLAAHVGISASERADYLSGRWRTAWGLPAEAVERWERRWPGYASPQALYPTKSPNACYVGLELLPLEVAAVKSDGLWYTPEQHEAVALLGVDLARRHSWPRGWQNSPRLVGHEDLDAKERWDRGGGWDPGGLRARPRIDWHRIAARIQQLSSL